MSTPQATHYPKVLLQHFHGRLEEDHDDERTGLTANQLARRITPSIETEAEEAEEATEMRGVEREGLRHVKLYIYFLYIDMTVWP